MSKLTEEKRQEWLAQLRAMESLRYWADEQVTWQSAEFRKTVMLAQALLERVPR